MGHCRHVSYSSLRIQAASITMSFLSEHYQLYYCMLPQCSCFTNTLHAHPTIQSGREVTVHPDNTHLRLNISLDSTVQHTVQCKMVLWQQCAR